MEEVVTNQERAEVKKFLRIVMETQPMQFCHRYCRNKKPDLVPADRDGFIRLLQKIWFDLYRRDGARDSSGFEHVFVGEIKVSPFNSLAETASCEQLKPNPPVYSVCRMAKFLDSTTGFNYTWRKRLATLIIEDISNPVAATKHKPMTTTNS